MESEDKGEEYSGGDDCEGSGGASKVEEGKKEIDLRLVEKYINASKFCREDMKDIDPGWGYDGPIQFASESLNLGGDFKAYRTVASEDYAPVEEIFREENWVHLPNSKVDSALRAVKFKELTISHCFLWIPSDIGNLLKESVSILEDLTFSIIKADMLDTPDKDYFKLLLVIEDGTEFFGEGSTPLEAALSLYINCWEFDYDMRQPSLIDLSGDFTSDFSWNEEPTLIFEKYEHALQFVDEAMIRYSSNSAAQDKRSLYENSYVGLFHFLEGDYHVIFNSYGRRN